MANCKYCGEPAGFLRRKHPACEQAFQAGERQIATEMAAAASSGGTIEGLPMRVASMALQAKVSEGRLRELVVAGWISAVDKFLEDGVLDEAEEQRLLKLQDQFELTQTELDTTGAVQKVAKAGVLRDVLSGVIPERINLQGAIPFNLQRDEKVVWAFPNSKYLEEKTRKQFVGGSRGVSVRIMKGVYYRVGDFKGQSIEHTERVHVDSGLVALTTKHIYFAGPSASLRIPYSKIVSFQPFSNGIGIVRDARSAKPQLFETGDGWFAYNLAMNLSQLEAA